MKISKSLDKPLHKIVLFEPQIPQNTGNIVRTCAVTNADLILVRPLGFHITNHYLKRAGLDYWDEVNVSFVDNLLEELEKTQIPFYFFSSKATKYYTDIDFIEGSYLIFGSETKGLPPIFSEKWPEHFYKIPMQTKARCLNLSNAVAIVIYESWRQKDFK